MNRRVKIHELGPAIADILEDYGNDINEATKKAVKEVAEIAKQEIKSSANVRTGKYRAGWAVKENATSRLRTEAIVYNKKRYMLTHLLENGHRLIVGGRSLGSVRAFPHIAPAEEHAIKNMEEALKQIAKG